VAFNELVALLALAGSFCLFVVASLFFAGAHLFRII
jgi:hypothetical protein